MDGEKNSKEMSEVLNNYRNRKRITIIIGALVVLLGVAVAIIFINNNKEDGKDKKIEINDILVDGDKMTFKVDRNFQVYDKDPTVEYPEGEEPAKALKDIDVVIDGTADYLNQSFDGKIEVDGYELDGNVIGYYSDKTEIKDGIYLYSIGCMNATDKNNVELNVLNYEVTVSDDLSEILIYIWFYMESGEEPVIIYSKL